MESIMAIDICFRHWAQARVLQHMCYELSTFFNNCKHKAYTPWINLLELCRSHLYSLPIQLSLQPLFTTYLLLDSSTRDSA
jgi:hypothetical protein